MFDNCLFGGVCFPNYGSFLVLSVVMLTIGCLKVLLFHVVALLRNQALLSEPCLERGVVVDWIPAVLPWCEYGGTMLC